jgi:phytol kinase
MLWWRTIWNMAFALMFLAVFLLLVGSELWWRRHSVHGEFSRKFVHITVGTLVAFWPFFLSWNQIRLLSLAFLIVISVSKHFSLFRVIHAVQRPTGGELYFALAVGVVTLVTQDKWIYLAAVAQMSLADGLAAVMGTRYGKQSYLVFGHTKSVIGTLTFFTVSLAILIAYAQLVGVHLSPLFIAVTAALAALIENLGVRGLDNLLVPLFIAVLLAKH